KRSAAGWSSYKPGQSISGCFHPSFGPFDIDNSLQELKARVSAALDVAAG
nr:hypothetical protein [Tanacetum cinerariifolium]